MFGIGASELIVIAVLALLIIGPKDLPKMARDMGSVFGKLKKTAEDFKENLEEEIDLSDPPKKEKRQINP